MRKFAALVTVAALFIGGTAPAFGGGQDGKRHTKGGQHEKRHT